MPSFDLILRLALLSLSFGGLCGTLRHVLKLHRLIAPCFTACTVICVLMVSGMLRVLGVGLLLLYAAGLAGFVYTFIIKKVRPDLFMIGLLTLLTAFFAWRFMPCKLDYNDDFSHWALIVRHLLENDAFPNSASSLITFRSYPPAAACFAYYADRILHCGEGLWLTVYNLLLAVTVLPLFAFMEKGGKWLAPLAPALFLLLFKSDRPLLMLVVDWHLCGLGIAMASIAVYERRSPRRAFLIALPCMLACIWMKSSGIFFSVCTAFLLAAVAGKTDGRKAAWKMLIAALTVCVASFLLWNLHVKLTFPVDGLSSKHAVSLDAYVRTASGKSPALILSIAKKMVRAWLRPADYQIFALGFLALCIFTTFAASAACPALRACRAGILKSLGCCVAVYAVWYGMMFFMYVFSMPADEASALAAYSRYDSTGIVYVIGLACVVMLHGLTLPGVALGRRAGALSAVVAAALLVAAPMMNLNTASLSFRSFYADLVVRDTEYIEHRSLPMEMLENYDIPRENGKFIICLSENKGEGPLTETGYVSKYELHSADIAVLMRLTDPRYADAPYLLRSVHERHYLENPIPALAKGIDQCDAILVYGKDPEFQPMLDEFLAGYTGDTPVYYADR